MIKLVNVSKEYGNQQVKVPALRSINLHIEQGEFISIMGPSGCGKTTLLNIIGLLDRPTAGSFMLSGADTSTLSVEARARERNKTFGFVFQSFELLSHLTAVENVNLPLEYSSVPKKDRRRLALKALALTGIEHLAEKKPAALSGGEQQRVAIARAIVNKPSVILADEPTGNLDRDTGRSIMSLMKNLCKELGTTIVLVTHDSLVASYSDRILQMLDGAIISDAPMQKEPYPLGIMKLATEGEL